jgi:hypothetical protein
MWGIFACNELLCERFGMVETPNCTCCGVVETPWHAVGEKQKEEREELRKEVKELWDRDRRSMTMRIKHPLVYYLESNKRVLNYRM